MTELNDIFLNAMLVYGAPALALALLIGSLGIPLPVTMLLIAAGAFARHGILDWRLTAALALLGAVLGDSASYYLGRTGGMLALKRVGGITAWRKAQRMFDRWGDLAVLLTRFLLTPLAIPTNLIAGGSRYTFRRFLAFGIIGELLWVTLFGGLGYLFADQWETLNRLAGDLSGLFAGTIVLGLVSYLAYRHRRGQRYIPIAPPTGAHR